MTGTPGGPARPATALALAGDAAGAGGSLSFSARRTASRSKRVTPLDTGTAGTSPLLTSAPRVFVETPRYSAISVGRMSGREGPSSAMRSLLVLTFSTGA